MEDISVGTTLNKFEVLKDIKDLEWYHATKRSNLDGIKKRGLVPSKEFDK